MNLKNEIKLTQLSTYLIYLQGFPGGKVKWGQKWVQFKHLRVDYGNGSVLSVTILIRKLPML